MCVTCLSTICPQCESRILTAHCNWQPSYPSLLKTPRYGQWPVCSNQQSWFNYSHTLFLPCCAALYERHAATYIVELKGVGPGSNRSWVCPAGRKAVAPGVVPRPRHPVARAAGAAHQPLQRQRQRGAGGSAARQRQVCSAGGALGAQSQGIGYTPWAAPSGLSRRV